MKKIKVHILRKVYLGRFETKEIGGEIEFSVKNDSLNEFKKVYKEFDEVVEDLANKEAIKNKERRSEEFNKDKKKRKKKIADKLKDL